MRRTALASALTVALGAGLIGGISTTAHAVEQPADSPFELVAYTVPATTIAPFASAEAATEATEPTIDEVEDAATALAQAEDALAAADAAADAVADADLDVAGATSVDTSELEAHVTGLTAYVENPDLLVTDVTDETLQVTAAVVADTADLRTRLKDAQAKKAAEEAAAKKAAEEAAARKAAEAAAAASSSARSSSSSSSTSSSNSLSAGSAASSGDNSVAGAKATAKAMLSSYGWGSDQFSCLEKLWKRESGWNYKAYNSSSGAYGIPQALPGSKMASAGSNWKTSAATQIKWGLGYISSRYSTPCGAWSHSQSSGWY